MKLNEETNKQADHITDQAAVSVLLSEGNTPAFRKHYMDCECCVQAMNAFGQLLSRLGAQAHRLAMQVGLVF